MEKPKFPGNFPIDSDNTTLAELIDLAGGLTDRALTNGAYMIRANLSNRGVQSATNLNTSQLMRTSDQVLQGFEYLEMERDLNSDQRMFIDLEDDQAAQPDSDHRWRPCLHPNRLSEYCFIWPIEQSGQLPI